MVYSAALVKVFAAALLASSAVTGLQLNGFEVAQREHVVSVEINPGATGEPELIVLPGLTRRSCRRGLRSEPGHAP